MAAQTLFSVEFPGGCPCDPPSQLVMLATVAAAEGLAESGGPNAKEMMELQTVGSDLLDCDEESSIRYSYDNQSQQEVCIIEYPESPGAEIQSVLVGGGDQDEEAQDLSKRRRAAPVEPRGSAVTLDDSGKKRRKPFHCKPCNFHAQSEAELVQHLSSHAASKMKVVTSVEGGDGTKDGSSPAEGKDGGDGADSKGLIRCERCGYNTNRYDHYIAHLKHHSKEGQDTRVFKCTLCTYTTVSQYHWRKHLRNHFPSKLHTCSQCSYFSDRKSNYIQHIRTHTGVRPFQCPYCDYSSSQKTHLTRHKRTHSGERPFKCESCNYLAANQHEVTRHARQVHNGPKPLGCPFCEYRTADRSNYKKHVEMHLKPRQFLCPHCKYAASKKCNLQYHLKSRHSGCDAPLDISKVKLRVKKPPEVPDKLDDSSGAEEDADLDLPASKPSGTNKLEVPDRAGAGGGLSKDGLKRAAPKKTLRPKKSGEEKSETRNKRKIKTKTDDTAKHQSPEGEGSEERAAAAAEESSPSPVAKKEKKVNKGRKLQPKKVPEKQDETEKVLDLSTESKVPSKRRRLSLPESPSPGPHAGLLRTRKSHRKSAASQQEAPPPADAETAPMATEEEAVPETPPEVPPPAPTFAVPTSPASPAPPGPRRKPTDAEEDEGIHSSHEGASDISDSASEGSDDSGLHSNATASGKPANDPETPTDEIPTPTELKSHLCIFCDRTFPLEAAYRRHLNRHLVNVYDLEAGQQQ